MSNLVFPALAGFDIKVTRREMFSTLVQNPASGKELRASLWSTPRYRYSMNLNFARQNGFSVNTLYDELATLVAFFRAHQGKWDSFWLVDPAVQNLIPNPTSEDSNPTGFAANGVSSASAFTGTKSRLVTTSTSTTQTVIVTDFIPCQPGDQFYLESMIFCSGGIAGSGACLDLRFFAADKTTFLSDGSTAFTTANAWGKFTGTTTAPAGASYIQIWLYVAADSTGPHWVFFDNMFACRMEMAGLLAAPDGVRAQVSGSADFQRRVRFDMDELSLERIVNLVWSGGAIEFISEK